MKRRISSFLLHLTNPGVGVDKKAGIGIAGKEGKNALLSAASLGDIVPFYRCLCVLAMPGDGVEIQIKGAVAAEVDLEAVQCPVPAVHEADTVLWVDPTGIFGQALSALA